MEGAVRPRRRAPANLSTIGGQMVEPSGDAGSGNGSDGDAA